MTSRILSTLLDSADPAIRYKACLLCGDDPASLSMLNLQEQIKTSPRVRLLLSERNEKGEIPYHPYSKWYGAHWVMVALAELGYPPGDESLLPLRAQEYAWLLHIQGGELRFRPPQAHLAGRPRICASLEGNALYALLSLGLGDDRLSLLVDCLLSYQWEDGGWNCSRHAEASHSSFMETLIPLRALSLYARHSGDPRALAAAERAAEVFLKRRLFKRQRDGALINPEFIKLHYPCYWRYDILFALKVMAETGFIADPRCQDALDLLESKHLPGGGFACEGKFYKLREAFYTNGRRATGFSRVDWGPSGRKKMNEWVTADALLALKAAGRLAS